MEYYCLGENYASATLSLKFMVVVKILSVAKSQNFVDISGVQKPAWAKNYLNKNQLGVTSFSYINLIIELLIKLYLLAQKQYRSEVLSFFGSCISIFL